tara:strand:- start:16 stop:144 length:129 start_codon:yes stop_codon:yes gene_type:complete
MALKWILLFFNKWTKIEEKTPILDQIFFDYYASIRVAKASAF